MNHNNSQSTIRPCCSSFLALLSVYRKNNSYLTGPHVEPLTPTNSICSIWICKMFVRIYYRTNKRRNTYFVVLRFQSGLPPTVTLHLMVRFVQHLGCLDGVSPIEKEREKVRMNRGQLNSSKVRESSIVTNKEKEELHFSQSFGLVAIFVSPSFICYESIE